MREQGLYLTERRYIAFFKEKKEKGKSSKYKQNIIRMMVFLADVSCSS
jgi:hypothetical protein